MNDARDLYLCRRFPQMFRDRHASIQKSCMPWGFECGDGWFDILEQLCGAIMVHCESSKLAIPVVTQVKEKFGTLRFYLDGGDATVHALVGMAEGLSAVTCDECGAPGHIRGGGWLRVLCDEHAPKGREAKPKELSVGDRLTVLHNGHFLDSTIVTTEPFCVRIKATEDPRAAAYSEQRYLCSKDGDASLTYYFAHTLLSENTDA